MNGSEGSENQAAALLGLVADEFLDRLRRGESPDIDDYVQRYPEIAAIIGEVFPALCVASSPNHGASAGHDGGIEMFAPNGELGDYRIVREIGRGGMGIVYEATQLSLGRQVALKVLPFAAVLDNKQLQRFRTEAQAAAQLHHSSIVPVYSVGCERGVHFYAMQYIEGQSISTVIAQLRKLESAPQSDGGTKSVQPNDLKSLFDRRSRKDAASD